MRDLRAVSREKNAPSGHRRAIGDPVSSTPALPASLRARNRCRGVRAHLAPRPENSPEFLTPRNRPSLRRWRAASALGLGDDAGSVLARREGLALRKRRRRASERASPEVREARWFATRRWAVSFLFAQRETRATSSRRFRASLGPGCPGQHPNRPRSRFACAIIPTTVGYQQPVGYSCPACGDVRRRAARAQSRRRRRLARWHVPARPSPRASPARGVRSRERVARGVRARVPPPRGGQRRGTQAAFHAGNDGTTFLEVSAITACVPLGVLARLALDAYRRARGAARRPRRLRDGRPLRPSRVYLRFHPVRPRASRDPAAIAIPVA